MKYLSAAAFLFLLAVTAQAQVYHRASLVYDINQQGPNYSSDPAHLTIFNNRLYFSAFMPATGRELWHYDGNSNPAMVADFYSGGNDGAGLWSWTARNAVIGDKMYYLGNDSASGWELYSIDTADNIALAADINPGPGNAHPYSYLAYNNLLYFFAQTPAYGRELWQYDPATGTASRLSDIMPGPDSGIVTPDGQIIAFQGKLYFAAADSLHGEELFSYDPAMNSIALVADINPDTASSAPATFITGGDKLWFSARTTAYGRELYSYNGIDTPVRITDIYAGAPGGVYPVAMAWYRDKLIFSGRDSTSGWEPFAYDTTAQQATMISDLYPGAPSSGPGQFTLQDTMLFFTAIHPTAGQELWQYDGVHPPQLTEDFYAGPVGGEPTFLTVFNGKLYMNARNLNSGFELFVLDSLAPNSSGGIQPAGSKKTAIIYPNPVRDELFIQTPAAATLYITDITGNTVLQKILPAGTSSIPVSNYTPGIYLYSLYHENGLVQHGRFVRE